MKFTVLCLFSYIASSVAKPTYFELPLENKVYRQGETIEFIANGVSHDDDTTIRVSLHASGDDGLVKNLGDFNGKEVSSSGDDFSFSWLADIPDGQYYVEVAELEEEDEDNDEDDGEDDEENESNRSHDFQIVTYQANTYSPNSYPGNSYPANAYPASPYPASPYPASPYPANPYPASSYPANSYPPNQYQPNQYQPNPWPYSTPMYKRYQKKRQTE